MSNTLRDDEWLTIEQAAQYLKVSTSSLYRWRDEGRLKFYRLGPRTVRVRKCDLDALAEPEELSGQYEWIQELFDLQDDIAQQYGKTSDSVAIVRAERALRDAILQKRSI